MSTATPSPPIDQDDGRFLYVEPLENLPLWNLPTEELYPSPENEQLYRPIVASDPEMVALTASVKAEGILEPLVVTQDGYILSGHRRHAAATAAGLPRVPCRVYPMRREEDPDRFVQLLRAFNRQRVKTFDEKMREALVDVQPAAAHKALVKHRKALAEAECPVETFKVRGEKARYAISKAKEPFLTAVQGIVSSRKRYWPLSDRQIHYQLLNAPPLTHASKPASKYANTPQCYKTLTDLLTRGRLAGRIPMEAIADATRPVNRWKLCQDVQTYLAAEAQAMFGRYARDLLQSQPNHIEIVAEKMTVQRLVERVAEEFCIPVTISRGFCSLAPRHAIAQRFQKSGKARLTLLILSDFDPDGLEIAHSLCRSLRDEFGVSSIDPVQVALTAGQVKRFNLVPVMQAKTSSANYRKFREEHGNDVFELEALPPETLQAVLREKIRGVIDRKAFQRELEAEKQDAVRLAGARAIVQKALAETASFGSDETGETAE
jgi:ParB-like chromosome segregation protein Spo0J